MTKDDATAAARTEGASEGVKAMLRRHLPAPAYALLYRLNRRRLQVQQRVDLAGNLLSDMRRYLHWSHTGGEDAELEQWQDALLKLYHSLEKGLSMPAPRAGFGESKARLVVQKIDRWLRRWPPDEVVAAAVAALLAYRDFNRAQGVAFGWLDRWLDRHGMLVGPDPARVGGTERIKRDAIRDAVAGVGADFFRTRHSVRHFTGEEVPLDDIRTAVDWARKTPSVCNRQGWRAHCFADASTALNHQPGNGGFGHRASRAIVVTCDLQAFCGTGERHQAYVDGGLFAMSVVYALHALGHGACMLAWTQPAAREAELRRTLGIPDSEAVIMMIAVGGLPESLEVPVAWRRPLAEILHVH